MSYYSDDAVSAIVINNTSGRFMRIVIGDNGEDIAVHVVETSIAAVNAK